MDEIANESNISKARNFEKRELTRVQMWCYAFPYFGLMAIIQLMSSFSAMFYIFVMGVPPIFAGVVYGLGLYLYALMGPICGTVCDKYKTRFGRKKTFILISAPIICVSYLFIWAPPPTNTIYGQFELILGLSYIISTIVLRIFDSLFSSAYLSMLPEISTVEENRVKTSMVQMLASTLGSALGIAAPIIFMGEATENLTYESIDLFYHTSEAGKVIYGSVFTFSLILMIIFAVSVIFMMVFIKEPDIESSNEEKMSLRAVIEPVKDKNMLYFLLTYFITFLPMAALMYLLFSFATYVIDLRGSEFYIFGGIALVVCILSFTTWEKLTSKLGLKKTYIYCILLSIAAFELMLILIIPMDHTVVFIIGIIVLSFGLIVLVGSMIFPYPILADIIDSAEEKTGRNLSGSYQGSLNLFGALGSGTAMIISTSFLQAYGEESSVPYMIIFFLGGFFLLAGLLLFRNVVVVGTEERRNRQAKERIK